MLPIKPILIEPIEIEPTLQDKTIDELKTIVTADLTIRDLLIQITGSETIADEPVRTYRKDGQIESQSETFRDVETNEIVSTKQMTWTYYKTGEVDEITITENGKTKVIKHYIDGRQPTVMEVKLIEVIDIVRVK